MNNFKKLTNIAGWVVFGIAFVVYFFSAERTGSLWDCGEFITGAYKLQVVHPPGAPLFILIGRMFTFIAQIFYDNPENIAFSVNILSGICSAFAATFVCWSTIILGKLTLTDRESVPEQGEQIALAGAGVVAGLATAFCTSVWFSAVEGEVYAMSTFFTTLTLWASMKWYALPDKPDADRWLIFAFYAAGLSVGVHLLSILTFPALALFYYFKKYEKPNIKGMAIAAIIGVVLVAFLQTVVITGIPNLWSWLERTMVNDFGLPFHSGIYPLLVIIGAIFFFALRYARDKESALLQKLIVMVGLVVVSYSTFGVVIIRANANPPINMNDPSDPLRLLPYLNREQYGERPLMRGPHYQTQIIRTNLEDRYGRAGDKYEIVDQKASYEFDPGDQMLFPRLGHLDENRKRLYEMWLDKKSRPTMGDNIGFFFRYQIGWMYFRYFMWNFAGRQNGQQGFYPWDKTSGHWISGIPFIDNARLGNQSKLPESLDSKARNKYYLLPLIFGLIGMFFHFKRRPNDFLGLLTLFIITGIGIIVYSNQPPNEPRERDYVLVGSFFTFCIWMGMGVLSLFLAAKERFQMKSMTAAMAATALVLVAPVLMGTQNFDDNSRRHHKASRDYASNFLNSCEPNAIIFTYGDNDTYPLWYAQEVENIRTDVRVVNLSLIAVDWYIDQLRRKINDSPRIKMSLTEESIRGFKRTQIPVDPYGNGREMSLTSALKVLSEDHPIPTQSGRSLESFFPTRDVYIPVNRQRAIQMGLISSSDTTALSKMKFRLNKSSFMLKGDAAVLDIINSNIWDRPIYFAVTCRRESLMGLENFTQLEGLALRLVPVKSKGDPIYGMIGNGRVNTDKYYDNFMTKFKWGNFDKMKLFVDNSYGPTIQTTRFGALRTARTMLDRGDKDRAVELVDKYFEAFPHMNFPYDANTILFINIYAQAGDMENVKKHMRILAKETADQLEFIESLGSYRELGYDNAYSNFMRAREDMTRLSKDIIKDEAFDKELNDLLGKFASESLQGRD
ncbi:MAG: DUF2723 domain-containing protein [Bacteroidota bacterium]